MESRECKHLKKLSWREKHKKYKATFENEKNTIVCGICNCYQNYTKTDKGSL